MRTMKWMFHCEKIQETVASVAETINEVKKVKNINLTFQKINRLITASTTRF